MSDFLLELGQKAWARKAISTLGLPLPMPQALERGEGSWKVDELSGRAVLLGGFDDKAVSTVVSEMGARDAGADEKVHALVYDARDAKNVGDLERLYEFFHANIRRLGTSGRIVLLGLAANEETPAETAAAAAALTGFTKSVAKEVGKKGATANVIYVEEGAEHNIAGPLRFFLSPRSAFVDGQVVTVSKTAKPRKKVTWAKPLDGKTALVTGAARGIGEEIARRLAEEGAKVIALDIPQSKDELEAVARKIGGVALLVDITAPDAVDTILAEADKHGGLDIVVNNAGITRDKTLANMDNKLWNQAINVNLKAALDITEGALSKMKPGGRAIFLSSIAGIAGNFGQTNYGAAKAGIIGAVKNLGPKFAAKGSTVNGVAPGFIETRLTAAIPLVTREAGRRLANLGQGGLPVDVAELITFLVTPGAAGVNGQIIRVCGGNYLGA